uniref:Uncharacterized protein n=1 Tax=Arundo donax TaxID=35708 RepID=A0A0A9CD09_ARUDO
MAFPSGDLTQEGFQPQMPGLDKWVAQIIVNKSDAQWDPRCRNPSLTRTSSRRPVITHVVYTSHGCAQ